MSRVSAEPTLERLASEITRLQSEVKRIGFKLSNPRYKKDWITTGEAGKRLGYTPKHIRDLCSRGKLVHKVSDEGRIMVSAKDIDRVLNEELSRGYVG